jgi:hypothetical protein
MRAIFPGMTARLNSGVAIPVTDVLLDTRTHALRYLVLSPNGYFGQDVLAPAATIMFVDDDVHLALTNDELVQLPYYDHYAYRADGLCSRSAYRHGADRRTAPRPRLVKIADAMDLPH